MSQTRNTASRYLVITFYKFQKKSSDHKEADTMLVAFVESAEVNGSNVMVRFLSGDMDILVLFILHLFLFTNNPLLTLAPKIV